MTSQGFDFTHLPRGGQWTDALDLRIRYGYLGSGLNGYISPLAQAGPLTDSDPVASNDGAAYLNALWGSTASGTQPRKPGCYHEANVYLFGSEGGIPDMPALVALIELQSSYSDKLYVDPSIVALQHAWSECMRAAGYSFAGWYDAVVAAGRSTSDASPPSASEIRQAEADATCRKSLHFELALFEREADLQAQALKSNETLVSESRLELSSAINRASVILGEHTP